MNVTSTEFPLLVLSWWCVCVLYLHLFSPLFFSVVAGHSLHEDATLLAALVVLAAVLHSALLVAWLEVADKARQLCKRFLYVAVCLCCLAPARCTRTHSKMSQRVAFFSGKV